MLDDSIGGNEVLDDSLDDDVCGRKQVLDNGDSVGGKKMLDDSSLGGNKMLDDNNIGGNNVLA